MLKLFGSLTQHHAGLCFFTVTQPGYVWWCFPNENHLDLGFWGTFVQARHHSCGATNSVKMPKEYIFTLHCDVTLSCRSAEGRMVYIPTFNDRASGSCCWLLHLRSSYPGVCIASLKNVFIEAFVKLLCLFLKITLSLQWLIYVVIEYNKCGMFFCFWQEFCLFAVLGLGSDFFLQMFFFTTVLSIDIRRMEVSCSLCCLTYIIFTARRYAKRGICRRRVSVCLVTLRYCIKTAKRRITQTTQHDCPVTSFLVPKIMAKFKRDHPLRRRQMQVGWVRIGHFQRKTRYNSKTVQDRRIVSIKVE